MINRAAENFFILRCFLQYQIVFYDSFAVALTLNVPGALNFSKYAALLILETVASHATVYSTSSLRQTITDAWSASVVTLNDKFAPSIFLSVIKVRKPEVTVKGL